MSHIESYRSYYAQDNKLKQQLQGKLQFQHQSQNQVENKENTQILQNNAVSSNQQNSSQPQQLQLKLKQSIQNSVLQNQLLSKNKEKDKQNNNKGNQKQNVLQPKQTNTNNHRNALEELRAKLMLDLTRQSNQSNNNGTNKSFNKQKSQQIQQKLKSYHVNIDMLSKKTNSQNDILLKKLIKTNNSQDQPNQKQHQLCEIAQMKRNNQVDQLSQNQQQQQTFLQNQQMQQQQQQQQLLQHTKGKQNLVHQILNEKTPYLIQDDNIIQKQINMSVDQEQDSCRNKKQTNIFQNNNNNNNNYLCFENSQIKQQSSKEDSLQQFSCSSGRLKTESGSKQKQNQQQSNTYRVKTESDDATESSAKYIEDLQKNTVKAFQEQFFVTESARLFNQQQQLKVQSYLSDINLSLPNNNKTQNSAQDNSDIQINNNISNINTSNNNNNQKLNSFKENITDRRRTKINRSRNKSLQNAPYKLVTNNISGLYQDKQQVQLINQDHSQNRKQLSTIQQKININSQEQLKNQQLKQQNIKDSNKQNQQQKSQYNTLHLVSNTQNQQLPHSQIQQQWQQLQEKNQQAKKHSIQLKQRIGEQLIQDDQLQTHLAQQNNYNKNYADIKNQGTQSLRQEQDKLNQILKKMLCVESFEDNSTNTVKQVSTKQNNYLNDEGNYNRQQNNLKQQQYQNLQQTTNLNYQQQNQQINTVQKQNIKPSITYAITDKSSTLKCILLDEDKSTTKSSTIGSKKIYLEEMFLQNQNFIKNTTSTTSTTQITKNEKQNKQQEPLVNHQQVNQNSSNDDEILIASKYQNQSIQDNEENKDLELINLAHENNNNNTDSNNSNCLDSTLVCNEQLNSSEKLVTVVELNSQNNSQNINNKIQNDENENIIYNQQKLQILQKPANNFTEQIANNHSISSFQQSCFIQEPNNTPQQKQQNLDQLKDQISGNQFISLNREVINNLVHTEQFYYIDPHYFQKQKEVTWIMRAILLDWMMEVCMEFMLKKDTFYLAQYYVDRYLSTEYNIKKVELQLIGVTSMFMASKLEEIYPPRITDFVKSTDDGYSKEQIEEVEIKLCKVFKWKLNPPNLNVWQSIYTLAWDNFIEEAYKSYEYKIFIQQNQQLFQFRKPNELSYVNFRQLICLLDIAILESSTLQYQPRALLASFIYLLVGIFYKQFEIKQVVTQFPHNSGYLFVDPLGINELFNCYLIETFQFNLIDLLPTIQYAASFFDVTFNYDLPTAVKYQKENSSEVHNLLNQKNIQFKLILIILDNI